MTAPLLPTLVAHRGYPRRHPENTLAGLAAALEAGARYVELDVQLSADGVPVLQHDIDLVRTAGRAGRCVEMTLAELRRIDVSEVARLGPPAVGHSIATLDEALALLRRFDGVTAYVEIKPESAAHFGLPRLLARMLPVVHAHGPHLVVISSDEPLLRAIRRAQPDLPIGWILRAWDDDTHRRAADLAPALLVCSRRRLPPEPAPLWPGPWRWMVYTVDDPDEARRLAARGVELVETDAIAEMLAALEPARG